MVGWPRGDVAATDEPLTEVVAVGLALVPEELPVVLAVPVPVALVLAALVLDMLILDMLVLALPAVLVVDWLPTCVVAEPAEEKLTLPLISNWLCGGGGTVPDVVLIDAMLDVEELTDVLEPDPLAETEPVRLAVATDGEQLLLVPLVAA